MNLGPEPQNVAIIVRRLHERSQAAVHTPITSVNGNHKHPMDSGSRKRRLVSDEVPSKHSGSESDFFEIPAAEWSSTAQKPKASGEDGQSPLRRSISPPPSRPSHKKTCNSKSAKEPDLGLPLPANDDQASSNLYLKPSPIQLSTVNGLPPSNNVDTVSLGDILGDPLIRECWLFNYLFDVDYIMYMLSPGFLQPHI